MAETLGILLLCVTGLVCVVLPCLVVAGFVTWLILEAA